MHVVTDYPSPVEVTSDKELRVTNSDPDSREVISQAEEPTVYDSDKEIKSDDIEKSNTLIAFEDTPMITKFTDVFPKDNTPIPPEDTPVITEFANVFPKDTPISHEVIIVIIEFIDVFSKNLPNKLAPMHDIQHTIEYDSKEVIYQVEKEACEGKDISHNCIRQTLSTNLHVVSSTFSQLKEKDNGKWTAIFHTIT